MLTPCRCELANLLDTSGPPCATTAAPQLFQGKIAVAVETSSRAVDLCQQDEDNTPDTDALGQVITEEVIVSLLTNR